MTASLRSLVRNIPGFDWLYAWIDPLNLARRTLKQAVEQRVHFLGGDLIDIGCGEQPYKSIVERVASYVSVDLPPNSRATVHADGMALPFLSGSFDSALCNQVPEHVPEPGRLFSEAARVLKPGGTLLLTSPQTWGLHHEPHDYFRYTRYGLRYLAEASGLRVLDITPTSGVWGTITQRLADTVAHTYVGSPSPRVRTLVGLLLAPMLLVGYGLDKIIGLRGDTLDNVLVAQRPE